VATISLSYPSDLSRLGFPELADYFPFTVVLVSQQLELTALAQVAWEDVVDSHCFRHAADPLVWHKPLVRSVQCDRFSAIAGICPPFSGGKVRICCSSV